MTLGCEERRFRLVKPAAVKGHFFFCLFFGDTGRFAPDSRSQTVGRRRASVFLPVFRSSTGMWQRARRSRRLWRPLRRDRTFPRLSHPAQASDSGTLGTPSPTGWCENAGVVCRPREGQAPPLRDECEAVGRVRIRGTSRTPSPTGVDRTRSCNLGRLIAAPTSKRKRFSLLLFSVPICGIVSV